MSGRLRFEDMPETWELARKVLDEALRSLREVLERGFRWREQVAGVVDTTIDTAALPLSLDVPRIKVAPLAVMLLSAIEQRSQTGERISGGVVEWEWRGGRLVIHDVSGLTASTRYNATFAVME
jgi:hypothetical protein